MRGDPPRTPQPPTTVALGAPSTQDVPPEHTQTTPATQPVEFTTQPKAKPWLSSRLTRIYQPASAATSPQPAAARGVRAAAVPSPPPDPATQAVLEHELNVMREEGMAEFRALPLERLRHFYEARQAQRQEGIVATQEPEQHSAPAQTGGSGLRRNQREWDAARPGRPGGAARRQGQGTGSPATRREFGVI